MNNSVSETRRKSEMSHSAQTIQGRKLLALQEAIGNHPCVWIILDIYHVMAFTAWLPDLSLTPNMQPTIFLSFFSDTTMIFTVI